MWAARALAGAAAAALTVGAVATVPAVAAPAAGSITVALAEDLKLGAEGSPGKVFPLFVAGSNAANAKVVIDLSDVSDIVEAEVLADIECVVDADSITCPLPDGEFESALPLAMRALEGAAAGAGGTIKVAVSADNATGGTVESTLALADGVDLVATISSFDGPADKAEPGDTVELPIGVANAGNHTSEGLVLTLTFDHGLVPATYRNCTYAVQRLITVATCTLDGEDNEIAPGGAVGTVVEATVAADGYGFATASYLAEAVGEVTELPSTMAAAARSRGGSKVLDLKPLPAAKAGVGVAAVDDIDESDNLGGTAFDLQNQIDIAAVGATASGAVGATVKVAVGVKNVGKGSIITFRSGGEPAARFQFDVPPDTEVVTVPDKCAGINADGQPEDGLVGRTKYLCRTDDALLVGETYSAEFGLKIITATPDAKGKVTWDKYLNRPEVVNPANDVADVVINPTSTGGGGGLPITGTRTGLIAASGAGLLVAGVVLLLASRRRREVVAPPAE
jgi:LPXTG-motif cell wall-anchored protein